MIRVGVTAVGICGSDLHWFAEGGIGDVALEARGDRPAFAGVALGGPQEATGSRSTRRFRVSACEQCREGYGNLCPKVRFAGHGGRRRGAAE